MTTPTTTAGMVGRALRTAEPVPDRVIAGARAAWTWRTIDEELAELVFDSALVSSLASAVRTPPAS